MGDALMSGLREQTRSASYEAASALIAALESTPDKRETVLSIEREGQRLGFSVAPKMCAAFGHGDEPQPPGLNAVQGMADNYELTRMDATRLENHLVLSRHETQAGMKLPPPVK